ncbi:ankyrin repeat domain-containing protein, partial [Endozoicomonas sp. ONNA2]|uniref:ankyrin repeat domain-containing protein n=1 Tax=Endozoicomonas sp. ONNA2 TaxID=2828741 RepID=UPI002148C71C
FSGSGGRAAGSVCSNVAVNSGQFLNAVGINVNEKDNNGNTVLHKAGCGNKSAGVKDWSFSGYFENARSAGRRLPASKSSENKAGGGNESAGVKDWYFSSFFENKRPAVELSASKSAEKSAPLKYRSCVEERINTQVQPLNESLGIETLLKAVDNGLTETVKNMLAIDRSPGIKALHDAAKEGHTETIQKLLKIDPSLAKETDMLGRTALHFAAEKGHTEVIQTLWDNDHSLVKEKDSLGQTALHKAAREGHAEAIQALLKFDSPLAKEKDCRGRTALNIAARHGHTECEKLLKNAGKQFPQRQKARCSQGTEARCSKDLEACRAGIIKSVYQQKSGHKTQM